jgi:glycosyltransferase involved in cell wall biosynthesis
MNDQPLRVCYFGTYDRDYVRNRSLRQGLRQQGVEVLECHATLWRGTTDKVAQVGGGWKQPAFWQRVASAYTQLLRRYRQVGDYDVMVVGYIGHLDMQLARLLARRRHKPLVFDVLMSIHLIASERGLAARNLRQGHLIGRLEERACRLADMIWLDTPQYVDYFHELYGLPPDKFRLIPLGADESLFYPTPSSEPGDGRFRVVYFGGYVPLHGVNTVVEAARIMRDEGEIHFELIGEGQSRPEAETLARQWNLPNVTFTGWVPREELAQHVAGADVCLGVFGRQTQAQVTIPNKIYEGLALRQAVVTQGSPAAKGQFVDREHLLFCDAEDAASLANAIRTLREDPALRARIVEGGYRLYQERYTTASLGQMARNYLEELLEGTWT